MNEVSLIKWFGLFLLFFAMACHDDPSTIQLDYDIIQLDTKDKIMDVHMVDATSGYAVGGTQFDKGFIATTSDGWVSHEIEYFDGDILNAVSCVSDRCLAAGYFSFTVAWRGLEKDWSPIYLPEQLRLSAIAPIDSQTYLIVGGISLDQGIIQKVNHERVILDTQLDWQHEFECVTRIGARTVVGGYGIIMTTDDDGDTWEISNAEGDFFTGLSFPTGDVGYAVGEFGSILKSKDAGQTWSVIRDGGSLFVSDTPFREVCFINEDEGYIVGKNAILWITTDGGDSWHSVSGLPDTDLEDISVQGNYLFVAGSSGQLIKLERP